MILHQLKLALRLLVRQRIYSLITILGFALGISAFLFISIFLLDRFSYDRWVEDRDHIYRLEYNDWALTGSAQGPFLARVMPEVEKVARVSTGTHHSALQHQEKLFSTRKLIFADSCFLELFPLDFKAGRPDMALSNPLSIVLTERMSQVFFGQTNPLGQIIRFNDMVNLEVTGIVEEPTHFHLEIDGILPFHLLGELYAGDETFLHRWDQWNYLTYMRLTPGTDVGGLEEKINQALYEEIYASVGWEIGMHYFLRPLSDVFFATGIRHISPTLTGHLPTVRLFLAVALFILLIAIVNFVNLSTARSALRAREVGIRRLLGGHRSKLILQFLAESVLITALAVVLALILVETGLPHFRDFAGVGFRFSEWGLWPSLALLVSGTLLVGLLAGIYPSIYMTAFLPVEVLKGHIIRGRKGAIFRKVLISFQFIISIMLIASTIVISNQIRYMRSKDLGIQMENTISFQLNWQMMPHREAFRNDLASHPSILGMGLSSQVPGQITWQNSAYGHDGESRQYTYMTVDVNYLPLMGVEPLAGRLFCSTHPSDHLEAVVINEQAVRYFGYPETYEEVIGLPFHEEYRIVGVIPDFHFNSLHSPIAPLVVAWNEPRSYHASIRIDRRAFPEALTHIESTWYSYVTGIPFNYDLLEEAFDRNYQEEEQLHRLFVIFSVLAILIACLGLFGLASFMAERRSREMAVRKVMGARMGSLAMLMLTDFLRLVGLALILATPLAWFLLNNWLDQFPYRMQVGLLPFILAGLIAAAIACITVSYHAIKASTVNPGEALKYE